MDNEINICPYELQMLMDMDDYDILYPHPLIEEFDEWEPKK